ncbi:hypothetical protein [Rhizobium sp. SSA_523]|uniref:hypothetical protein n=1 Tax=Rhizobium sp. SSA_523 TaxID=2952477 RepID=UPI002659720F|nr:hypothetical protein [Rhizobium sp. SSA_523]WKC23310.1 hypothetical protein QTJ18_21240 [Rhizobium sp. SSA_523]
MLIVSRGFGFGSGGFAIGFDRDFGLFLTIEYGQERETWSAWFRKEGESPFGKRLETVTF